MGDCFWVLGGIREWKRKGGRGVQRKSPLPPEAPPSIPRPRPQQNRPHLEALGPLVGARAEAVHQQQRGLLFLFLPLGSVGVEEVGGGLVPGDGVPDEVPVEAPVPVFICVGLCVCVWGGGGGVGDGDCL